jgi:hypothetical protein
VAVVIGDRYVVFGVLIGDQPMISLKRCCERLQQDIFKGTRKTNSNVWWQGSLPIAIQKFSAQLLQLLSG